MDPTQIAEIFANQFEQNYIKEPDGALPSVNMPRIEASLDDININVDMVQKALSKFDDTTATGPDGIPSILLKKCSQTLVDNITCIMNESLMSGRVPADWKIATVVPIYKKGNKLRAANYRPISLTSVLCKCMEKIIADKLRDFLKQENIVLDEQHGFVPKRSVVTNLLMCVNKWIRNDNDGYPTDVVYLDYEKAFDRVPLRRLLIKLEHFGIRGRILSWISDFLTGRSFRVRIGDALSTAHPVLSGVPQGSVLGPLIFILYLTDLKITLRLPFSLFADDTKFFATCLQHRDIQEDLDAIFNWTKQWLLSLNASKCTVLHIGKNNPRHTYYLHQQQLTAVDTQRDLGVTISHDLKWGTHITGIVKKANSMLYLIRKAFKCLTPKTLLKLYKTYIRPLLEYAYVIWDPYFKKDIAILEGVQRRATKMAPTLKNKPYEERLHILGLMSLENRRKRGCLIETYKILTDCYNVHGIRDLYTLNQNKHLRGHSQKLSKIPHKGNPMKHFLPNRVVTDWNKLPESVINAPTLNCFKNRLDNFSKSKNTHASAC